MSEYLPLSMLVALPESTRNGLCNDLGRALSVGGGLLAGHLQVLVSTTWLRTTLEAEIEDLEAEADQADLDADAARADAAALTGAARSGAQKRAMRAASDAYDARRALDAVRLVLAQLDPEPAAVAAA